MSQRGPDSEYFMLQEVGFRTRHFIPDGKGGLVVTEEWPLPCGGGYPYITIRYRQRPTAGDLEDLAKERSRGVGNLS